MKKIWMALSIGSLLAASALAESMSGTISDANCGAKHAAATEKDTACVKSCVKRGAAPVFVSGRQSLQDRRRLARKSSRRSLGQKVTVNGKVEGDTVTIESRRSREIRPFLVARFSFLVGRSVRTRNVETASYCSFPRPSTRHTCSTLSPRIP